MPAAEDNQRRAGNRDPLTTATGRRLLIRPGAVGDCICSLPALESLRATYTEVWVASPNVPLIRFAERVRSIASTGLDWLEIDPGRAPHGLVDHLRSFDSIVSWYGAARSGFRAVIERLELPFELLQALPAAGSVHTVDFYLNQARVLGGAAVPAVPRLPYREPSRDYIAIQPFSGSPRKNWPLARFRSIARELAAEVPVRWTAGPTEELSEAERFSDLGELGAWLARARVYIGNDSGITHLAAAAGTPVVAIFGPTSTRVWEPRGDRVRVVQPPAGGMIEDIQEKAVLAATRDLLAG